MTRTLWLIVACLALTFTTQAALAAGDGWTDDFEAALKEAKKENKDLLLDFTGSDWCSWCIKLRKEVFDTEAFKKAGPGKFVLVELDFPQAKTLDPKTKAQNEKLQKQFNIQGFPTILLMDAKGQVYAQSGYRPGGPEKYLAHLDEKRELRSKRDEILAKADKAQGAERAKLLDQAVTLLGQSGLNPNYNQAWIKEIVKLDAQNEAGLKAKYETMLRLAEAEQLANRGQFEPALALIDKILAESKPTGQAAQDTLFFKAICLYRLERKDPAMQSLKAALDAAPQGEKANNIKQALESLAKE